MRQYTNNSDGRGNGPWSDVINRMFERFKQLDFYDSQTIACEQTTRGTRFHVINPNLAAGGGGFMGEYDQNQSYDAGDTFIVSVATTIAGIAVIAGYYGVPPAGDDVNGLPWSGFVPANPTGNAVPQSPLPSLGASPNDKFYAKLIMPSC